ncbi:uncharacterized protein LOC113305653 [Papaver somniferum]|uniref:uncharacterized protein LOC113305653 n=1 Tax=Papaver somniferum TaxID=3469 RepID=UPI000E6F8288|nr:uncharacterized protein LOC113305653 [Papaver somniferum]
MNSNFLVLIHKIQGAKKAAHFRPIGLSDFCFKVFTKIITSRFSALLPKRVSPQKVVFIKDRCIHENIVLASELVNEMKIKRRGEVGLKLDITQAYDTLSWEFLLEVLRRFGFSSWFCDWILKLLDSARISILLNGGPIGFFDTGRGLKQGDPLSPVFFVIAEDVLSRKIFTVVHMGHIQATVNRGGIQPSHLFFADDIIIFCNGTRKNLLNLMKLLLGYQQSSGQVISRDKSKCFVDVVVETRKRSIADTLYMELENFPDKYLGIMLMPGIVKRVHVKPFIELLQSRHASWIESRKCITLKWEEVCIPEEEGGLGIRILEVINKAMLMKLLWKILNENGEWAKFFRAKFMTAQGIWINHYKQSSIMPGIKCIKQETEEDSRWIVGDGNQISIWFDQWIGEDELQPFISLEMLPVISQGEDKRIWCGNQTGKFKVADAYNKVRFKKHAHPCFTKIWAPWILPDIASNVWKLRRGICATDENMNKKGFGLASRCFLCKQARDSVGHILWYCNFGQTLWKWLGGISSFLNLVSFDNIFSFGARRIPIVQQLWRMSIFTLMVEIRFARNRAAYDGINPSVEQVKRKVLHLTYEYSIRMNGNMWNHMYNLMILKIFGLSCRPVKQMKVVECFFHLPIPGCLLICCDGASRGNPSISGYGFICRTESGEVLCAEAGGLGIATNFIDEVLAIIKSIEWAVKNGWFHILIQSNSQSTIRAFQLGNLPWIVLARWYRLKTLIISLQFRNGFREINFSADSLAKKGCMMCLGQSIRYLMCPPFLSRL